MVIDTHIDPSFFFNNNITDEHLEFLKSVTGLYKTTRINEKAFINGLEYSKIDKVFLLPLDLTTTHGKEMITNEEVSDLVEKFPDHFIGFASIDPNDNKCVKKLEYAFDKLKLSGLYLHPSLQKFYPNSQNLKRIYDICLEYNKPIIFKSGITMDVGTLSKYSKPLLFEEVLASYPNLRVCLSNFGWPWVNEVCSLMVKYKNLFADTSCLYFDNAKDFYDQTFRIDIGKNWIDKSLRYQVMFASAEPRLEQMRMKKAIENLNMREKTKKLILGENALVFLEGMKKND